MPVTQTNTHTHSLRTDATGPDLATSFPWGNTRRHQLSGARLLCFPRPLLLSPPISQSLALSSSSHPLLSHLSIIYFPTHRVFLPHFIFSFFCLFNHWLSFKKCVLHERQTVFVCFACEHVSASRLDCGVYDCMCARQWDWIAAVRIAELWRELWRTLPAVYTHQTHTHTSTNTHTDWGLPPDLTH